MEGASILVVRIPGGVLDWIVLLLLHGMKHTTMWSQVSLPFRQMFYVLPGPPTPRFCSWTWLEVGFHWDEWVQYQQNVERGRSLPRGAGHWFASLSTTSRRASPCHSWRNSRIYKRLPCSLRLVTAGVGRGTMQVLKLARCVILGPTAPPKVFTTTAPSPLRTDVLVFDDLVILCFQWLPLT